jgi:hypothetical protein
MKLIRIPTLAIILFLVCIMPILGGCSSKSDGLVGTWERSDSSQYKGMRVMVEKLDNGEFRGTVVAADSGKVFKVDDIKWKGIKNVKENDYEFKDLGTDAWYDMRIILNKDHKTLVLRNMVDTGETGATQPWTKVTASK